jgi:hypothetical protein
MSASGAAAVNKRNRFKKSLQKLPSSIASRLNPPRRSDSQEGTVPAQESVPVSGRPKTLEEAKQWMRERLRSRLHPMSALDVESGNRRIDGLRGLEPDPWTDTWGRAGDAASAALY